MLVDDLVVERPDRDAAVEPARHAPQVRADPCAGDGGGDRVVIGPRPLLAVAPTLGIEGVDMGRAAPEPEKDARLGLALRAGGEGPRGHH